MGLLDFVSFFFLLDTDFSADNSDIDMPMEKGNVTCRSYSRKRGL